jgi:hypothetical protein
MHNIQPSPAAVTLRYVVFLEEEEEEEEVDQ